MLSSMTAQIGGAGECVWYGAAKGAVDSMVVGVAREVVKEGVRVNAVTPGVIDTDIQPPGRLERVAPMLPMGRPGQANEVAEAVMFLLSDAASYITGANLRVSGAR
jgi:NAD(P)-dependent dehydrogenase (short-subunit alcohol dehydrogenase family)